MRRFWPAEERRDRRSQLGAALIAALAVILFSHTTAFADLKLPPRPRGDPPMRIIRVTSSDPACEPNCPEWISAEGRIMLGTAVAFVKAINGLGGRRLPVLIASHGGALRDAVAMGVFIREHRLAVAVARTIIANCPERTPACPNARGEATADGAFCASACPLILAGGVARLVGPVPLVGVHQITTVTKEEGEALLPTVRKIYEQGSADAAVERYWTAMGIGDPVMSLLRKTPASSIRWLSPAEISASHLATAALDPHPILATGANGLNAHAFVGDPRLPDLFTARGVAPLGPPEAGTLEASFAYRSGGGALEVALVPHDNGKPPSGWTLRLGGGEPLEAKASGSASANATIPRGAFCAAARDGKLVVAPVDAAPGADPQQQVAFGVAAMDGAKALIDEACP